MEVGQNGLSWGKRDGLIYALERTSSDKRDNLSVQTGNVVLQDPTPLI
jgi:hypothetical protein